MSVTVILDPASVTQTTEYLEEAKYKILEAVREGMKEAMINLAWNVAGKLQGDPIITHTGGLLDAILNSPRVTETAELVRGTVSSDVNKKHIGLWLEEGTHVPAVLRTLYEFTEPDGETFFTHGHQAFDVKPHPFMNPALEESQPMILETIRTRIEEALPE
jgi:hypothetical protein